MKETGIKARSLHYRLATVYSDFNHHHSQDICIYIRKVVRGFLNILLLLLIVAFVIGGSIVHLGLGIYFSVFYNLPWQMTWQMTPIVLILVLASCVAVVFLFAFVCIGIKDLVKKKVVTAAEAEKPVFVIAAYRNIKAKTCSKIKIDYEP